jgi:hypothetical protein
MSRLRIPFRITRTSVYQDYLTFWLDANLDYKDKSANCITVYNKPPFTEYKAGDDITIDTEITSSHPQSATFGESVISKKSF